MNLAATALAAGALAAAPTPTGTATCASNLFWVQVDPHIRSIAVFRPVTIPRDANGHVTMAGAVLRQLARIGPTSASLQLGQDCSRAAAPRKRADTSYLTTPFSLAKKPVLFCHGPPEVRITLTVRRRRGISELLVDRGRRRIVRATIGASSGGLSYDIVNCSREEIQRGA